MSFHNDFVNDISVIESKYKDKWFATPSHSLKYINSGLNFDRIDFLRFICFVQTEDCKFGASFEVYDFNQGLDSIGKKFIPIEHFTHLGKVDDQEVQDRIVKTAKRKLVE